MSMVDIENLLFWTAFKVWLGGAGLAFVVVFATINTRKILEACTKLPEDKKANLRKKFRRSNNSGNSISFILILTSTLDIMADDLSWKVYAGIDSWMFWVIFRIVMLVGLWLYYGTNKIHDKRRGHGSGTTTTNTQRTSTKVTQSTEAESSASNSSS